MFLNEASNELPFYLNCKCFYAINRKQGQQTQPTIVSECSQ